MNLRQATHADIPKLVELFIRLKRVGPYAFQPHDLERARKVMRQCISSAQGYLGVVELNEQIYAALMGVTDGFWWGPRRYASDLAFFSQAPRAGELLVKDFCSWAWKQNGVIEVLIGQSSGLDIEATHYLFESLGFDHRGGLYALSRYEAEGKAA